MAGLTVEFRGDAGRFTSRVCMYLAALAVVCSIALMGERWLRFALFSYLPFVPLMVLLWAALRRFDRFMIDDERGVIRAPGRGEIPLSAVSALRLHDLAGVSSWTALTKAGPRPLLAAASPADDSAIREALERRTPQASFRESSTAGWWLLLGLLLTPLALHEGFLHWLRGRRPEVFVPCIEAPWRVSAEGAGSEAVEISGFQVTIPAGFRAKPAEAAAFIGPDGIELQYEASRFEERMSVSELTLLRLAVGVGSPAQAMRWAGCAERGVLPLMAKAVLVKNAETRVAVFPNGAGLLQPQLAFAAIDSHDAGLEVTLRAPGSLSEDLIAAVVAGVHAKRPGEPWSAGPPSTVGGGEDPVD